MFLTCCRKHDAAYHDKPSGEADAELARELVEPSARCVLGIEHADQFFQRIWVEMNRRSADLTKLRLVFIGDGAEWIWRRVADVGDADSVHILDFCHGVDHLAEVCKLLYGQGTGAVR